jgi:nucleoside-diphosphate kinase
MFLNATERLVSRVSARSLSSAQRSIPRSIPQFSSNRVLPQVSFAGVRRSSTNVAPIPLDNGRALYYLGAGLVGALSAWGLMNSQSEAATVPHTGIPGTNRERTFIAIKPDGVQRGLIAEIIARFEKRGYKLVGIKVLVPSQSFAEEHYADLKGRPFFPGLVKYFSSGPVVAMIWEGTDVILQGRKMLGTTNPLQSPAGSIRGDFCIEVGRNIIHGSDSAESAQREIALWFKESETADYTLSTFQWVTEKPNLPN